MLPGVAGVGGAASRVKRYSEPHIGGGAEVAIGREDGKRLTPERDSGFWKVSEREAAGEFGPQNGRLLWSTCTAGDEGLAGVTLGGSPVATMGGDGEKAREVGLDETLLRFGGG